MKKIALLAATAMTLSGCSIFSAKPIENDQANVLTRQLKDPISYVAARIYSYQKADGVKDGDYKPTGEKKDFPFSFTYALEPGGYLIDLICRYNGLTIGGTTTPVQMEAGACYAPVEIGGRPTGGFNAYYNGVPTPIYQTMSCDAKIGKVKCEYLEEKGSLF